MPVHTAVTRSAAPGTTRATRGTAAINWVRNANMLPGSTRCPATLTASRNVRSMPSRPCINPNARISTNQEIRDTHHSAAS